MNLAEGLLAADEPPAYHIDNAVSDRPVLIVCDHASNRIPLALGDLGLGEAQLEQHIAWDLGAAEVAGRLAGQLDARVIYSGYSRLVVDVNRNGIAGGAVSALSDGILVPGNLGLSEADRQQRMSGLFQPYHEAVANTLGGLTRGTIVPVLLSIHSFTPFLHGLFRPWDIGILWDKDPRIAVPLLARLRSHWDLAIGDNLPYSGMHPADHTIDLHGEAGGLAHVGIEIRQDLIAAEDGQARFAGLLAEALVGILDQNEVYHRLACRELP
jgi:predicted N-formylglutamate amidohydrolase